LDDERLLSSYQFTKVGRKTENRRKYLFWI
jgi:hypothetical protein